ncbi:hypothetical protein [Candidatus Mycoplasma haematominutum]|uniref:Uncharacterized protein n=1 Tax=Candidatus Mycoplasma haematominutum 'Birmingham 1' TaxID=1116213 RepID=G8C3F8_9MOLU|nr:hypothetical protein [Candidatus Mycoplasma haematominutum]CCE66856.1 hypothetical protein MHM_03380 [Candidatus Mycoplasma haematominutum 'Birmingham 1']
MTFSPLWLKYAVIFAGVSSASVVPLAYSFGDHLNFFNFRGGQLINSAEIGRELTTKDTAGYANTLAGEAAWNDLAVNHAFFENMKRTVDLSEFKKLYGAREFKEEALSGARITKKDEGPSGAKEMTILDAWEKFFREDNRKVPEGKIFSYFREGQEKLPFWNYDFPYIAVEFPKNYELPNNLVKSTLEEGWVKVDQHSLPTELEEYSTKWKGFTASTDNFQKVMSSSGAEREEHKRRDTLNKIVKASDDADLYLVSAPEKLLRLWLSEWKDSKITESQGENSKYALFKNNHYQATQYHPEVSVLSRWHEGKTYRMWIHHKPLSEYQARNNNSWKRAVEGRQRISVGKDKKYVDPKLKWGNNFLLNLMSWYAYTYKLEGINSPARITYQNIAKAGAWNLLDIYELDRGANSKNLGYRDNFAKWISDWYSGVNRNTQRYWENVYNKFNLTDMTHFSNRWERIQWVGKTMDELERDWGQVKVTKPTLKRK